MEQDDKDWGNMRFRRRARYAEGAPEDNATARLTFSVILAMRLPLMSA
jgi:hypothetical protein